MRRCLGDHDLKGQGLIADPEVTCRELGAEDQFIVIATDGLWDKCDNTEAVNIVHDTGAGFLVPALHAKAPNAGSRCCMRSFLDLSLGVLRSCIACTSPALLVWIVNMKMWVGGVVPAAVKEPGMCAKRLATESLTRGSGDNIAVAVAFLQPVRDCITAISTPSVQNQSLLQQRLSTCWVSHCRQPCSHIRPCMHVSKQGCVCNSASAGVVHAGRQHSVQVLVTCQSAHAHR